MNRRINFFLCLRIIKIMLIGLTDDNKDYAYYYCLFRQNPQKPVMIIEHTSQVIFDANHTLVKGLDLKLTTKSKKKCV